MQHIDIINRIIETEKKARAIVAEAGKELAELDPRLAAERDALRASYVERAEKRIAMVAESEKVYADEVITKMDEELHTTIKAYLEFASENGELWADNLFRQVIGSWERLT